MAWAANGPVFGRAADDIFSGWISPSRYEPPANFEETFKNFLSWKNNLVAKNLSETTWHWFAVAVFIGKFAFPICEHSVGRDWQVHFRQLFVHEW